MTHLPAIERKETGWRRFWMTVFGRAYPRVIGANRERSWIFFETFMPLLGVAGYVLIYKAIGAPADYVGFVVLGGAMTAFWMNILWSMSSQLYWEKETGNLALYIMAPTSMTAILLGMALGGMFTTLLRAVSIMVIGSLIFQVTYAVTNLMALVVVFVLSIVALYGLGMMTASLFLLWSREAWHVANLAQEPIYFLSGFYFPIKNFPFWVALGASIIPLTMGLDAMRQLIFASGPTLGFVSYRIEMAVLAGLCLLFLAAAQVLLAYMEILAVREGRLTESRR